jgi:hypothetical protein
MSAKCKPKMGNRRKSFRGKQKRTNYISKFLSWLNFKLKDLTLSW